jgi:hypothetical protein
MPATPLRTLALTALALALGACKADKSTEADSGGAPDRSEALLVGCQDSADDAFETAEIAAGRVPTVPVVTWTSAEAGEAYVRFSGENGEILRTPLSDATTEGRVTLRGVRGGEEVLAVVVRLEGEEERCSPVLELVTDELPSSLPTLSFEGERDDGFIAMPLFTESTFAITVVDGEGQIVFYMERPMPVWRARFSRDGDAILFNESATEWDQQGFIYRVDWEGAVETLISLPNMHTDFDELPDGSMVVLDWAMRDYVDGEGDVRSIVGDRALRIAPDGSMTPLWNVFDHFTPDLSQSWPTGTPHPTAEEWSHTNQITYDDERDEIYLSVQAIQAVVGLDGSDGEQLWSVSAEDASILTDQGDTILNPHSIYHWRDDQYLVFNRNALDGSCSEVTALEFTAEDSHATTLWEYTGDDCYAVYYLGEARPLPDDDILVTWTTSGRVERITPEQENVWSLTSSLGGAFGFSDWSDDLYPAD